MVLSVSVLGVSSIPVSGDCLNSESSHVLTAASRGAQHGQPHLRRGRGCSVCDRWRLTMPVEARHLLFACKQRARRARNDIFLTRGVSMGLFQGTSALIHVGRLSPQARSRPISALADAPTD